MKMTNSALIVILLALMPLASHAHDERWNLGSATTAGAVLGGVIGYQIDKDDGAVIGAILGAVAGYSHHKSSQRDARRALLSLAEERRLRERIRQRIETETQRLSLDGNALFEPGTSKLKKGGAAQINSLAATLQRHDRTLVHISGYTDSEETEYRNNILSLGWAEAVARQLVIKGIPRSRIHTVGAGEGGSMVGSAGVETPGRRVDVFVEPVFDASDRR